MTTRSGWKPLPATTRSPSSGAKKGVRKEDYVLPWLRRMRKKGTYGVYFIFKSMEQGAYLPGQRAEVSDQGPQPPNPGAST